MNAALQALLDPILPVFAIALVGGVCARRGVFDSASAQTINRYVFYVGVPVLLFALLREVPLQTFEWRELGVYLTAELTVIAVAAALARFAFARQPREALLLGMAAGFVNHVFFVLPIGVLLYGPAAAAPIAAIIAVDSVLVFALAIVWLELAAGSGHSLAGALRLLACNPLLIAIAGGIAANLLSLPLPAGVATFTDFVGASAAPIALFALGIVLAERMGKGADGAALAVAALKLFALPLLAWALLAGGAAPVPATPWRDSVLLTAAGPCGAMPFVLALQYGVPAHSIARAIAWSTLMSLLTLAIVA